MMIDASKIQDDLRHLCVEHDLDRAVLIYDKATVGVGCGSYNCNVVDALGLVNCHRVNLEAQMVRSPYDQFDHDESEEKH